MTNLRSWFKIAFLLLCGALFFSTSCDRSHSSSKKTLKIYLQGNPISLDPRIGGTRNCQVFLRQLFEGLTRLDKEGKPRLAGAESVTISPDGLTYRFTLRDCFWSNGDPVTAHDYEYAWKSILSPNFPSSYSYAFAMVKNAHDARAQKVSLDEVGIHAENDKTLVVELSHPAPYFLEFLANPIFSPVSKKVCEKNPDWSKNGGKGYVGNGPFTLSKWNHSESFTLSKNPLYHEKDKVLLSTVFVSIVDDPQTALALFEKGEIDMCGEPFGTMPLDAIPSLIKERKLITQDVGSVYWLEVNTQISLLSSPKIRKALALSINRRELIQHLLQGNEAPAFSILPPILQKVKEPLFHDHDLARAKELFNEGIAELKLDVKALPHLAITHWSDPREKAVAQALQSEWQKAFGINVDLISCDWSAYFKKVSSSDYQIAGLTWWSWYNDPMYNLEFMKFKNSGLNGTGWENSQYISLLNDANMTVSQSMRDDFFEQAETLITEELPLIPVYHPTYKYLKKPTLKGFFITPLGQLDLRGAYFAEVGEQS